MFFEKLKNQKNDGFTLVELIVVIAILAILAGIAVPAYSGYIEKANVAADEQLLHAVNIAFASAAAEHAGGTVTNASLSYGGSEGAVTVEGVASVTSSGTPDLTNLKSAFNTYYGANNAAAFKTYTALYFNRTLGMFAADVLSEHTVTMSDGSKVTVKLSESDIQNLSDSTFINAAGLGAAGLLNKVDSVVGFGKNMIVDDETGELSTFGQLLYSDEYRNNLAKSLGFTLPKDEDAYEAKILEMSGGDENLAQKILVNNAVLYAAQNTTSKDELMKLLTVTETNANPKKAITDAMGGDKGYGLAQASAAYGLYTAYVYSLPDNYVDPDTKQTKQQMIDSTSDPINILNGLNHAGFQSYIKNEDGKGQAEKDLDAYLSSMNMINDSAKDKTAVESVLVNGFSDSGLIDLLEKTTAK